MFTLKRLIGSSLFVFVLANALLAQESRAPIANPQEPVPATPQGPVASAPLVTATATAKRVRFVSPGSVVQLRLEVFNQAGQKLFDTEQHGGNVLDWHLQDGAGERLPSGSYATVLTIKSLSGRLSQRVGLVKVNDKKAAIEAAGSGERSQLSDLSTAQQQIIGPVEGNAAFTILPPNEAEAITAIAHDGTDGQVTSTTGALTFRTGNVFAGKDKEHMRITEEGNVGIGTDKPAATLDVAGTIRTQNGIRFDDGTMLKSASNSPGSRTDANGDPLPALNTANTGTQDRLAKWTETGGAGNLGDSAVFESGGLVGIGTTSPEGTLHIQSPNTTVSKLVTSGSAATGRAIFQMYRGTSAAANGWDFGYNTDFSSERFIIRELTNGGVATRLAIAKGTGNVGIGTTIPTAKLQVNGSVNFSGNATVGGDDTVGGTMSANAINSTTVYRINNFTVLRVPGQSTFLGVAAGPTNTGSNNFFFGYGAGLQNEGGSDNSFFGSSVGFENTSGHNNSFFGSDAGGKNTSGNQNSFFGSDTGDVNTTGSLNSFFGRSAGHANTEGGSNSFFGSNAGDANTTGDLNSFFGRNAGGANTTGGSNSFFGIGAGDLNSTGNWNTFVGSDAGDTNTTGVGNTYVGNLADGSSNLINSSAIGNRARVTQDHSIVLGSIDGVHGAGDSAYVGIGTTAPLQPLHVKGFVISEGYFIRIHPSYNKPGQCIGIFASPDDIFTNEAACTYGNDGRTGGGEEALLADPKSLQASPAKSAGVLTENSRLGQGGITGPRIGLFGTLRQQQEQIKQQQKEIESLKQLVCLDHPEAKICTGGGL